MLTSSAPSASPSSSPVASYPRGHRAAPFIKWAGGKSRLLSQIEPWLPASYNHYHEPFLGGGAMFFHLQPRTASLSDINPRLVETWRVIRDQPAQLIDRLAHHEARHNSQYFYEARTRFNGARGMDSVDRAALFIYLNKTCFNGLYRENRRGEFNVPLGSYAAPNVCDATGIEAASTALQGADLKTEAFDAVLDRAASGDLVYFDPPYVPVSATSSFTSYVGGGFDANLQQRLVSVFDELVRRGCHVLLSNSDTPVSRQLYSRFRVVGIQAGRSINSRADRRGAVGEILVVGGV
jgi:DNA adenine methylase